MTNLEMQELEALRLRVKELEQLNSEMKNIEKEEKRKKKEKKKKITFRKENANKEVAIGLIRVSTHGQLTDGNGLDAQQDAIEVYAEKTKIELQHIFNEGSISGASDVEDRVQIAEILMYVESHPEVTTLIIPSLDRLARDFKIQEYILADFWRKGIEVISVREPDLLGNDSVRNMLRTIIGAFNEYDKEMIVARLKAGRIQKTKKGGHAVGRIPTGYKTEIDENGNKKLTINEEELHIIQMVFDLRKKGMSFQRIADFLNDNDITPTNGGKMFYTSTVQKIYKNPKYRGTMSVREDGQIIAEGKNEELRIIGEDEMIDLKYAQDDVDGMLQAANNYFGIERHSEDFFEDDDNQ